MRSFRRRLCDCFLQEWSAKIIDNTRFAFYSSFKNDLQCERYLGTIEIKKFRDVFIRFRLGNNELRSNTYPTSSQGIMENCPFCSYPENEIHFMLFCTAYADVREKYISQYLQRFSSGCTQRTSWSTVTFLVNGRGTEKTRNVAMFIYYSFQIRTKKLKELACLVESSFPPRPVTAQPLSPTAS